jgi:CMP-N-acetylneuraminic acid synthetase
MERNREQPYEMVVLFHPSSSPIRDPKHIDEAIERLERSTLSTLASVCAPRVNDTTTSNTWQKTDRW